MAGAAAAGAAAAAAVTTCPGGREGGQTWVFPTTSASGARATLLVCYREHRYVHGYNGRRFMGVAVSHPHAMRAMGKPAGDQYRQARATDGFSVIPRRCVRVDPPCTCTCRPETSGRYLSYTPTNNFCDLPPFASSRPFRFDPFFRSCLIHRGTGTGETNTSQLRGGPSGEKKSWRDWNYLIDDEFSI